MEEQDVASLLASDISANLTMLQLGGFALTIMLALAGVLLAIRSYAVLSEARSLYWQAHAIGSTKAIQNVLRVASPATIQKAHSKRKLKSNRLRGLM